MNHLHHGGFGGAGAAAAAAAGGANVEQQRQREREESEAAEKRRQEETDRILRIVLGVIEGTLVDYRSIPDQAIRHSLFVDKFAIALRIGVEIVRSAAITKHTPPDLALRTENVCTQLLAQVTELGEWIRSPMYNPDHPYGHHAMQQAGATAQKAYESLAQKPTTSATFTTPAASSSSGGPTSAASASAASSCLVAPVDTSRRSSTSPYISGTGNISILHGRVAPPDWNNSLSLDDDDSN